MTDGLGHQARFAGRHDLWFDPPRTTQDAVDLLTDLAGPEPVLELGIGTGRVALPLRARGVDVHGVESSPDRLARLRDQPGGALVPVAVGDVADVPVPGTYSVIYVAAGGFFTLPTQADQVRCFRNVARRLAPGGVFVLDAVIPEALAGLPSTLAQPVTAAGGDVVEVYRFPDPATQTCVSHYLIRDAAGLRTFRVRLRYAGHGELDLMAHLAGLRLRHRWGNWAGEPFDHTRTYHVSAYEPTP